MRAYFLLALAAAAAAPALAAPPAPPSWLTAGPDIEAALAMTSPTITRGGETIQLRPENIAEKPLEMKVPQVHRETLPSGLRLYVYEDHSLPLVNGIVLLPGGDLADPAKAVGTADLVARGLQTGGAADLDGDQMDEALERLGSEVGWGSQREYLDASLFTLSKNTSASFELLAKQITQPRFEQSRVAKERELMLEDIRRENDDPAAVARREFRKLVYGENSPMARTAKFGTVAKLQPDDIRAYYAKLGKPGKAMVGFAGDITPAQARALIETYLADWTGEPQGLPALPTIADDAERTTGVVYIPKQTAQSQIRIGHLGAPRNSPEQYALTVANYVYGQGGFSSMLMNRVRTKRGFVYGVSGAVQWDAPRGLFAAGAGSKSRTTVAAIREILETTEDLLTKPIDPGIFNVCRRDAIFSFFTGLAKPRDIVLTYMTYDLQGYPPDFLPTYPDRIRAVTIEQAQAAARKYIRPDRTQILVVGFDKMFDKPLESLGAPVAIKKLAAPDADAASTPAEGAAAPAPTPEGAVRASRAVQGLKK